MGLFVVGPRYHVSPDAGVAEIMAPRDFRNGLIISILRRKPLISPEFIHRRRSPAERLAAGPTVDTTLKFYIRSPEYHLLC